MRSLTLKRRAAGSGTQPNTSSPRADSRAMTAVWGIVGLLCSVGVILAVLDPSLTGASSGASNAGAGYADPSADDGFVPPPSPTAEQASEKQATPVVELDPVAEAQKAVEEAEKAADQAARLARADARIARHLVKLRAEREARTAAKHGGDK